ncbi:hypothetical protein FOA52_014785 [Chlamydomonas sp. UWO 241]|nr:hypothetical protein FOA52_014785 [Chlamydomonas sp. UWO 241]
MSWGRAFWRLVEGTWARNLANNLSMPRERRQQQHMDYERMFTLCRLHDMLVAQGGHPVAQAAVRAATLQQTKQPAVNFTELVIEAKSTPFPKQMAYVDAHVRAQLVEVAQALHGALGAAGDAAGSASRLEAAADAAYKAKKGGGSSSSKAGSSVGSSGGGGSGSSPHLQGSSTHRLGRSDLSRLLLPKLGFSLLTGPSSVKHPAAGQGLFLQGEALPGTVVAILPGLTYTRTQYSRMPNFPRVDTANPYLSRTYMMDIIDSKPWGTGDDRSGSSASTSGSSSGSSSSSSSGTGAGDGRWVWLTCAEARLLGVLEGRHPLALGHMVNHPAAGGAANVVEVPFTWEARTGEPAWLRAYVPCAPWVEDVGLEVEDEGGEDEEVSQGDALRKELVPGGAASTVRGLALVATRTLHDGEELLQNYRLNPRGPQPSWYTPVDPDEDARRWARLPLINMMAPPRYAVKP